MKTKIINREVLFSVVTALTFGLPSIAVAQTASTIQMAPTAQTSVAETSVISACGRLFEVDANAAGMTAAERAAIIQKNVDYALVHALHRAPLAVRVAVVNHNPVVTLDGFHIATADGNSAARHRTSPMQLAEQWAGTLRTCLADSAAVQRYISMLTGQFQTAGPFAHEERVAYARAGLYMPVKLLTPINSETSQLGDCVQVQLTADIPLPTSQSSTQYEAYLPCGTIAVGQLIDASNSYLRHGALGVRFDHLQTPDGETIPVNAHIMGGIGTWIYFNTAPQISEFTDVLGRRINPQSGLLAAKGTICGGWRGYPIGNGLDIPFQKLVFKRGTGIAVCAGEPMMLQLTAPTAIAVCTNCAAGNEVAATPSSIAPVAIGGAGTL